jgi:hypothetical protein
MIKINLANRKQSGSGSDASAAKPINFTGKLNFDFDFSKAKDLPIRQILIPLVACILGSYFLDGYKEDEIKAVDATLAVLNAERTKLQAEAAKMKGYEEVKKSLEADEFIFRTKIDTIQKLITDRALPPKVMLSLANATPKDVWLTEFKIKDNQVNFKGSSLGFNQISDFMKNLNESAYFSDLNIKDTHGAKDANGNDIATFELVAKRR